MAKRIIIYPKASEKPSDLAKVAPEPSSLPNVAPKPSDSIVKRRRQEVRATTVRLPRDLILAAKHYAVDHRTSLTEMIIEGLQLVLSGEGEPKKD